MPPGGSWKRRLKADERAPGRVRNVAGRVYRVRVFFVFAPRVFLFCVFFLFFVLHVFLFLSRKRCNSRKTCPGMFFLFCILCGNCGFVQENARSSVKNITTYVNPGKPLSFSRKLHSARGAKKKNTHTHTPVHVFCCSACAPRPRAHSLTGLPLVGSLAEIAI